MKKIIILLFTFIQVLLISSKNFSVKANDNKSEVEKNLICNVGTAQDDLLEFSGFTIKSSNVNFYKCGNYQVIYINDFTKEEVVKNVIVKMNDDLINGSNFEKTSNLYFDEKKNIDFKKILKDDNNYIISYNEKVKDEELFNIKLMKINDKEVLFDICLFEKTRGRISDFIIDNNKIILFIEKENELTKQDVYLYVYDLDGNLITSRMYYGSNIDFAKKIVVDEKYYYLIGDTYSDDDDYRFQHTKKSGYCFIINKNDFSDVGIYDATFRYDLDVIDAEVKGDYLYIITGYYNSDKRIKHINAYIYRNSKLQQVNIVDVALSLTESVVKLAKDVDNNIYLITSDYNYSTKQYLNHIYLLNQTCGRELLFDSYYQNKANANLIDVKISKTGEVILLYSLYDSSQSNQYGYLYRVYQNNELLFEVESFSFNEAVEGLIDNSPLELYKSSNSTLSVDEMFYINFSYTKNQIISSPTDKIAYPNLFTGGEKIELDLSKSIIPKDVSTYGNYLVRYYFNSDNIEFSFCDSIYFLPYTNIKDGGIYDINTIITFNGNATLNNYKIDNGYMITKPGDYTLLVTGVNDEDYEIRFTIEKLSSSEEKLPSDLMIVTSNQENIKVPIQEIGIINQINSEFIVPKVKSNIWYILIPITLTILFGIIIKKRG